jgi:hypothetical protein
MPGDVTELLLSLRAGRADALGRPSPSPRAATV